MQATQGNTGNALPSIIGLAGFKRTGKDTLADLLVTLHGYTKLAFAGNIRKEVSLDTGISSVADVLKDTPLSIHDGRTYRDLLLEKGAARRAEDPDYWVKALASELGPIVQAGQRAVIADVRMPNEIAWIRANGGVVIWVDRDGVESCGHETEQDNYELCDYGVMNSGSPVSLVMKMVEMLRTQPSQLTGEKDSTAELDRVPLEQFNYGNPPPEDVVGRQISQASQAATGGAEGPAITPTLKAALGRLLDASQEASELLDGCPDDDVAEACSTELSNAALAVSELLLIEGNGVQQPAVEKEREIGLNELGLNSRAINVLHGVPIDNVAALTQLTRLEMLKLRGVGPKLVEAIARGLAKHGLSFRPDYQPEPAMRYYAVTGRIPGDDEDATYVFQADDRDHAIEQFKNSVWQGKDEDHEDRVQTEESHGTDTFINSVLVSDSPITSL